MKKTMLLLAACAALLFAGAQASPADPLAVGAAAPNYTLPDQDGKTHTLAKERGHVLLLAFYPADFTGGCTIEAHVLSAGYKNIAALGVRVYGISVQDSKSHKKFCQQEGIPYTLLADTGKTTAQAYGVLNGGGYADRVTYIIGKDGKIAYVDPNVNGHLVTCAADWTTWLKAHPEVTGVKSAEIPSPGPAALAWTSLLLCPAHVLAATIGQAAPGFTLANVISGQTTSLASLRASHKAVVVIFISTQCPISNAYMGRMFALAKKYEPRGVGFAGIDANQTEPTSECAAYAKQKMLPFPMFKDSNDSTADAYDAHVTPESYVITPAGTLAYHGRIDNNIDESSATTHDLADAIDAALAGKAVAAPVTKAFGCSIKRG